jgi:uncharacterized membrane protein YfcA
MELIQGYHVSWIIALGLSLLLTGAVAGILAGLLGVGGGIVVVPVLYHLFGLLGIDESVNMHVALGTSLATIIATSIASARAHYRKGSLDFALLKSLAPAIFIGVVLGAVLAGMARGEVLRVIFAVFALLVAANMGLRHEAIILASHLPTGWVRQSIGVLIGGLSTVMGIGGGTLSVPILTACNYPVRMAVGTASAIGLIISLPGTIGFILSGLGVPARPPGSLGFVNLIGFALIVPTTVLLAPLGARIAHSINPSRLRIVFALFLFATAIRMLYTTVGS